MSGPFDHPGWDSGVSILAIVLRFTVWVLLILAAVWVIREILRTIQAAQGHGQRHPNPAVAELDMMYARGEVSRTEFLARRADLGGLAPPAPPMGV